MSKRTSGTMFVPGHTISSALFLSGTLLIICLLLVALVAALHLLFLKSAAVAIWVILFLLGVALCVGSGIQRVTVSDLEWKEDHE